MKALSRLANLLAAAALTLATPSLAATGKQAAPANPAATVVALPNGAHVVGSPQAKVKLVEYVSYTCPHCAAFDREAGSELLLGFIRPGKGSIEYRPFLRNVIDVAATLMVGCGPVSKFPANHAIVLQSQAKWFAQVTEAQAKHWQAAPDFGARMRAIAGDLHLYELFENRGYSRPDLDRCLSNEALARQISMENQTASQVGGVTGTPAFLLNDRLQDTNDWAGLRPILMQATR